MTGNDLFRRVRRSLWGPPLLLVPALAVGLTVPEGFASTLMSLIPTIFWPALLLLSLVFANSRLFFTSLLGALAWLSLQPAATARFLPAPALPVTLLFPAALAAITLFSGAGIVTQSSLKAWIAALLVTFLYLLWAQGPPPFAPEVRSFVTEPVATLPLPLSITDALHLLAALFLGGYAFFSNRITDGAALAFLTPSYLSTMPQAVTATDVAWILAPVAATAALLLEAYALAYVDTLTRLPARRAMESYSRQLGRAYAVAMLDIDHFKQFNDTHGHHVGDQVLRMVAGRLSSVGAGGKVFRYGGEEFTILFGHDEEEAIVAELEGLRKSVGDKPFVLRGSSRPPDRKGKKRRGWTQNRQKATVTISIGIAFRNSKERKVDEVRKRADEALYKAKKKGRNRVEKG